MVHAPQKGVAVGACRRSFEGVRDSEELEEKLSRAAIVMCGAENGVEGSPRPAFHPILSARVAYALPRGV